MNTSSHINATRKRIPEDSVEFRSKDGNMLYGRALSIRGDVVLVGVPWQASKLQYQTCGYKMLLLVPFTHILRNLSRAAFKGVLVNSAREDGAW